MPRVIDISLPLQAGYRMQTPEGVKNLQLEFELLKDYAGGAGQLVHAVHMRLHNGTHVDAPMHFFEGGLSVDQVSLETFHGEAVLADLSDRPRNTGIGRDHLVEALGGRPIHGIRVLLRTNWNRNYGEPGYEEGSPYITPEAVDWIVSQGPVLVGYDYAHGKDAPDSPAKFYSLRTFLGSGIVTMGYLKNLDQIDAARTFTLTCLPLAFRGVESSPVRAVAVQ